MLRTKISEAEHGERIGRVREELERRNLDALYVTSGTSFLYLTGFSYIQTERPAAIVVPADGEVTFLGPVIEKDHIPIKTRIIEEIRTYPDYPGEKHPMELFAEFLREMKLANKNIGIDNLAGASAKWGYEGPKITEKLPDTRFVEAKDIVEGMRLIKSEAEIELLKESAKWCATATELLQKELKPGVWDPLVSLQASLEASKAMKETLGPTYEPQRWTVAPAHAGLRGQVGEMSAIPHAMAIGRVIRRSDVLGTGAGADVGGYSSELERTMVVGKPTEGQRRRFDVMLRAQVAALVTFGPGVECSEVDKGAAKVLRDKGYAHSLRHHTGHGMGLEGHEPPWLDVGDDTVMQPGMVFSCEPGLYFPGDAGYRHSDTVVVTEDGAEVITSYPRDLESLTL
ncbi:MAG: M24 family metallopeptidase [Candidatus Geothermarchaeales archaeon]